MSDFRAIGGVSETLKTLLSDRMELPQGVPSVEITIGPPRDESASNDGQEAPGLYLYLFRVTESTILKNQEIPGHGVPGAYGTPPLSLNLHYLITAYGTSSVGEQQDETVAHYLLGSAMRVFHDFPIINESIERKDNPGEPVLDPALRGEFERIKLILDPISLEDLSKVWTAMMLKFRLSVVYSVEVVQIESQRVRRYPRPVLEPPAGGPRVITLPHRYPRIEEVRVRRVVDTETVESRYPYARIGDTIVLLGSELSSTEPPRIRLGSLVVDPGLVKAEADRVEIEIPDDEELQPGAQGIRLSLQVAFDSPDDLRPVHDSNIAVFVLVPRLDSAVVETGGSGDQIVLEGKRLAHATLDSVVLVGSAVVRPELGGDNTESRLSFPVPGSLSSGAVYPVRVRVNGAESLEQRSVTLP